MKLHQKGFALVESIIIILILAVVGFGGYTVWHNHKGKEVNSYAGCLKTPGANIQTSYPPICVTGGKTFYPPKSQTSSTQKYLTIKEWGVKIPTDNSTAGLTYKLSDTGTAQIRSTVLNSVSSSPTCDLDSIIVVRGLGSDKVPNETGQNEETFSSAFQNDKADSQLVAVQVGTHYYVTPDYRGASCVDEGDSTPAGKQLSQKEVDATQAIVKAINEMVAE